MIKSITERICVYVLVVNGKNKQILKKVTWKYLQGFKETVAGNSKENVNTFAYSAISWMLKKDSFRLNFKLCFHAIVSRSTVPYGLCSCSVWSV